MKVGVQGSLAGCLALSLQAGASGAGPAARPTVASCTASLQGATEWKVGVLIQRPAKGPAENFDLNFEIDNGRKDNRAEDERVSHGLAECLVRALNGRLPGEQDGSASLQFGFGVSNKPVGFDPDAAGLKRDAPVLAFSSTERPTGPSCVAVLPMGRSWNARAELVFERPGKSPARLVRWLLQIEKPLSTTERIKFQTFAFCTIGALGLPPARNALIDSATTVSVQSLP